MEIQKVRYKASQTARENGSASSAPRAKVPLPAEARVSTPKSPRGSFIATQPSKIGQGLILSNSAPCKDAPVDPNDHGQSIVPEAFPHRRNTAIRRSFRRRLLGASSITRDLWIVGRAVSSGKRFDGRSGIIRIMPEPGQLSRRRTRRLGSGWQWCLIVALTGVSRPALAQAPEVITPIDLFDPESGQGVTLGEKVIFMPRLEMDSTYDSNIYNVGQNEVDDFVASIRPRFVLRPDLARHSFELSGGAEVRRYADTAAENSEQYDIGASTFLDFADRTALVIDGRYRHGIDQRGTAGDQFFSDNPIEYDRIEAGVLLKRSGGFLEVLGEVRAAGIHYQDTTLNGVPIDLSDRDANVRRARVRASAPSSDHTRIFIQGSYNQVRYENSGPVSRNSEGYSALLGMHLLLTELIDIEAGAGYIRQTFDNPAVPNVGEINYHLLIDWTPRPDIAVTGAARRTVEPSPRPDVAAVIRSDFTLEAKKAIGDRLLATAEIGVVDEKYQGFADSDQRFHAGIGAQYRLTDNVGVTGRIGWRKQNGGSNGRDYSGVAATVGLRMYL